MLETCSEIILRAHPESMHLQKHVPRGITASRRPCQSQGCLASGSAPKKQLQAVAVPRSMELRQEGQGNAEKFLKTGKELLAVNARDKNLTLTHLSSGFMHQPHCSFDFEC